MDETVPQADRPTAAAQGWRMTPPEDAVTVEGEVAFHQVDALGIVWYGHYAAYFEAARTALLRSRQLDVAQLDALGYRLVVVDSHVRHLQPLRYGERFRCTAWFTEVDYSLRVHYLLRHADSGRTVAKSRMMMAVLDRSLELLLCTPDVLRERLRP